MFQKIYILNKYYSSGLFIHQRILKKMYRLKKEKRERETLNISDPKHLNGNV